jgi:hypothetical protein
MPGPGDIQQGVVNTVGLPTVFGFPSAQIRQDFILTGITRDAQGVVLGGCMVDLFLTATDKIQKTQVSDPTTGIYSFFVQGPPTNYYIVAYKAGAPDVSGTTVNTLAGS